MNYIFIFVLRPSVSWDMYVFSNVEALFRFLRVIGQGMLSLLTFCYGNSFRFKVQGDKGDSGAVLKIHFAAWREALVTIKEERAAEEVNLFAAEEAVE